MTKPVLSPEGYVNVDGSRCPLCGSDDIEATGFYDSGAGTCEVEMYCLCCDALWWDMYRLTSYMKLQPAEGELSEQYTTEQLLNMAQEDLMLETCKRCGALHMQEHTCCRCKHDNSDDVDPAQSTESSV